MLTEATAAYTNTHDNLSSIPHNSCSKLKRKLERWMTKAEDIVAFQGPATPAVLRAAQGTRCKTSQPPVLFLGTQRLKRSHYRFGQGNIFLVRCTISFNSYSVTRCSWDKSSHNRYSHPKHGANCAQGFLPVLALSNLPLDFRSNLFLQMILIGLSLIPLFFHFCIFFRTKPFAVPCCWTLLLVERGSVEAYFYFLQALLYDRYKN